MKNYIFFIGILLLLSSCHGSVVTYKMITYESKADVDTASFPILKLFEDDTYKVYKKDKLVCTGNYTSRGDSLFFILDKNSCVRKMKGKYADSLKNIIQIDGLIGMDIEAKNGKFKKDE